MKYSHLPGSDGMSERSLRIAYLINAFMDEKLTAAERNELDEWVAASEENLALFEELTDDEETDRNMEWFDKLDVEGARQRIIQATQTGDHPSADTKRKPYWLIGGLLMLPIMFAAAWLLIQSSFTRPSITREAPRGEPAPGSYKAILTMPGNRVVVLDSTASGSLKGDGVVHRSDTMLVYATAGSNMTKGYNKLTTPAGGRYQVQLSDGTHVWLNAASSLRYPAVFGDTGRIVELTGEAYFEVAKRKSPFKVMTMGATITVLGTHFNVQAYANEKKVLTTLTEGHVKMSNPAGTVDLTAGQQATAILDHKLQKMAVIRQADVAKELGWKNGHFVFRNDALPLILQELARWYNVRVVYEQPVDKHFSGTFNMNEPLLNILQHLQATGEVHFELKDNLLIVS